MPQLQSISSDVRKYVLPSTKALPEAEQAWVLLDIAPLYMADYITFESGDTTAQRMAKVFAQRIKDWNFTEADGSKSPIIYSNILRMDADDFRYLQTELYSVDEPSGEVPVEVKKDSTSTSTQ